MKKKITVIGLGYVGLPTLLLISETNKFKVIGYDNNKKILNDIKKGKTKINEKKIKIALKKNIQKKKFDIHNKLSQSDIFIITVPSNINKKLRQNRLPLTDVVEKISNVLEEKNLIIIETTSELGTTDYLKEIIFRKNKKLFNGSIEKPKFFMAYCPERVFPGNSFYEIKNNPRLIGGINEKSNKEAKKIFSYFSKKIFLTDNKTAEISKLVENSYRNVQIGFVNELANYAFKKNLNIKEIIRLSNLHPRINLLQPGIGVGGHCIPIDPFFLIKNEFQNFKILNSSIKANNLRTKFITNIIQSNIKKNKIKEINFFGATYKADVADFRQSPSLKIISKFSKLKKIKINIHDPYILNNTLINKKNFNINPKIKLNKKFLLNVLLVSHKKYKKIKKISKILDFTF